MRKRLFVLLIISFTILGGCDFLTRTNLTTIAEISSTSLTTAVDTTTDYQDTTTLNPTTVTTVAPTTALPTTIATTATPTTIPTTAEATTIVTTATTTTPVVLSDYEGIQDKLEEIGIPSTGNVKVLVFAVEFPDYTAQHAGVTIADIDTAFNGETAETAYESLYSYYSKSSFSQLTLTADIFGFYTAPHNRSYYENDYENSYPESDLIDELLEKYDSDINYSDYDANNDGFIDGIYIIYSAPVSFDSGSDLWWAYQTQYAYYTSPTDGVKPNYFVWMGSDFFYEDDGDLDLYEGINSRTLIHETGHMLGLDDYYDYDDSDSFNSGGLGGADIMDYYAGDHNPFSKMLLGWINPLVITGSFDISLSPYIDAGQTLMIVDDSWNGTIFDEYLLVVFYTPNGLNAEDKYFLTSGVIIYHIDARIGSGYDPDSAYFTIFNYNNSDTQHKLIKIIEADRNNSIESTGNAENSDMFQFGRIFNRNIYTDADWYQDSFGIMDFSISIGAIDAHYANISIIFEQ
ncbi:MAG: M6 family metalloprotease domain-containing protein [Candidatus Izemoplasmatales bacterium]